MKNTPLIRNHPSDPSILQNYQVFRLNKLLKILGRGYYLVFIDCERLDVNWNVIEKLLQRQG